MNTLQLNVESFVLDGFDGGEEETRVLLEAALTELAAKLKKTPLLRHQSGLARQLALQELTLDGLTTEQLRGSAGVASMADALYAALQRSFR